jgi:CRP-like cAMP-binding protein
MNVAIVPAEPASSVSVRRTNGLPWPALLGPQAPADAAELDKIALVRTLPAGATVLRRGTAARALVVLLDGQVGCGWAQPGRPLVTDRLLTGPAWLGLAAPLARGQHDCDAVAQSSVKVAELPIDPLRAALVRHPVLAVRFTETMAREVIRLEARLHELMHKDAAARLATWLTTQAADRPQPVLRLASRKRDIASQLGMTPETLSRMMRNLSERGLIAVEGYTVRVLDPTALQGLAGP